MNSKTGAETIASDTTSAFDLNQRQTKTFDNLVRYAVSDLATGFPALDRLVIRISDSITEKLDLQTYRGDTTAPQYGVYPFPEGLLALHEDYGPNPAHAILLMFGVIATAIGWRSSRRLTYSAAWLAGLVMFSALKRFGLWVVRYHLAGFVLAAPLVSR